MLHKNLADMQWFWSLEGEKSVRQNTGSWHEKVAAVILDPLHDFDMWHWNIQSKISWQENNQILFLFCKGLNVP